MLPTSHQERSQQRPPIAQREDGRLTNGRSDTSQVGSRSNRADAVASERHFDAILEGLFDDKIIRAARESGLTEWGDIDAINTAFDQELQRCNGDISHMWAFSDDQDVPQNTAQRSPSHTPGTDHSDALIKTKLDHRRRYPYPRSGLTCPYESCQSQPEVFREMEQFYTHVSRHKGRDGKFECPDLNCKRGRRGAGFSEKRPLTQHWLFAHYNWPQPLTHSCKFCLRLFETFEELKDHVFEHNKSLWSCWISECDPSLFTSEVELDTHLRRVHPSCGEVVCDYVGCGRAAYPSTSALKEHVVSAHKDGLVPAALNSTLQGPTTPSSTNNDTSAFQQVATSERTAGAVPKTTDDTFSQPAPTGLIFGLPTIASLDTYLYPINGRRCPFQGCLNKPDMYANETQLLKHFAHCHMSKRGIYQCPDEKCYTNAKRHLFFYDNWTVLQHWLAFHFKASLPQCPICSRMLHNFGKVDAHVYSKHDITSYICRKCNGASFKSKNALTKHINDNHKDVEPPICAHPLCGHIAYASEAALHQHKIEGHLITRESMDDHAVPRTMHHPQDPQQSYSASRIGSNSLETLTGDNVKKGNGLFPRMRSFGRGATSPDPHSQQLVLKGNEQSFISGCKSSKRHPPGNSKSKYPYPHTGVTCPFRDCPSSGQVYAERIQFLHHLPRHLASKGEYQCPVRDCSRRYIGSGLTNEYTFEQHWLGFHHNWVIQPEHQCRGCHSVFESLEELQAHFYLQRKKHLVWTCWIPSCNPSWFLSLDDLEVHIWHAHTGCGYVICRHPNCGHVAFQSEERLVQHVLDMHSRHSQKEKATNDAEPAPVATPALLGQTYCPPTEGSPISYLFPKSGLLCPFYDCELPELYENQRQLCQHIHQYHRCKTGMLRCPDPLCYTNRANHIMSFNRETRLVQHWLCFHFQRSTADCPLCNRHFDDSGKLDVHLSRHRLTFYTCRACNGSSFPTSQGLSSHLATAHPDIGQVVCPNYQCGHIAYEFNTGLRKHVIEGHAEYFDKPLSTDISKSQELLKTSDMRDEPIVEDSFWLLSEWDLGIDDLDLLPSNGDQRPDHQEDLAQEINSFWYHLGQDNGIFDSGLPQFNGDQWDDATVRSPPYDLYLQRDANIMEPADQGLYQHNSLTAEPLAIAECVTSDKHSHRTRKLPVRLDNHGDGEQPRRTFTADSTSSSGQNKTNPSRKRHQPQPLQR